MSATRTAYIDPASDLAGELRRASRDHTKVIVEVGGTEYRLEIEPVPKTDDEPDANLGEMSRRAILDSAGSWKGVDAEALKAYIRERRLTPSRSTFRD
ncbi:hypothetical protein BH23CHL4_BH23CHL4_29840 [soil metagenome]